MRRHLFALSATLLLIVPSATSAAWIALYPADGNGYQEACNFLESPDPGLREVAIVLTSAAAGDMFVGAQFSVHSTNINWTPLAVIRPDGLVVGGPDFAQVSFGGCLDPPFVIATIQFLGTGNSPCGTVWIEPPSSFNILLKCDYITEVEALVSPMTVNGVYDVPPGGFDPDCWCPTVGSEPSSWGKVKALYRN